MKYAGLALVFWVWAAVAAPAVAGKQEWLDLARRGWSYELRTTMLGRDLSIPVRIHSRTVVGAALCIVGEAPKALTSEVVESFRALVLHVFDVLMPMRFAGAEARDCGDGRAVVLRLYSGRPPNLALSRDIDWMNQVYELGLRSGRSYMATSPALAQTFFGRRGQVTHLMVQQPRHALLSETDHAFFSSILIEELFQSLTFGMDVLKFDRNTAFQSKLQEIPFNTLRLPWGSDAFREALLRSNPKALCPFDIFMMHAVAQAPVEETNTAAFIDYIDTEYERLSAVAHSTISGNQFNRIIDKDCQARL